MTQPRDIGAWLASKFQSFVSAVAAGAGDATELDGFEWADRQGYESVAMLIFYEAVLADGETLSIAANLQEATTSAGAGATDYGDAKASAVVATGDTGGTTERGVVPLHFNLQAAKRFIRSQVTPDLSAGATDTVELMTVFVFGGAHELPATTPDN